MELRGVCHEGVLVCGFAGRFYGRTMILRGLPSLDLIPLQVQAIKGRDDLITIRFL